VVAFDLADGGQHAPTLRTQLEPPGRGPIESEVGGGDVRHDGRTHSRLRGGTNQRTEDHERRERETGGRRECQE
jgi:hypothetical protein